MATRIIEFSGDVDGTDGLPVYPGTGSPQAALTATGTSAQGAVFASGTSLVLVQSDEAVYVKIGINPTATTNDIRLPANGEKDFRVGPGERVAVRT